MLQSERLNVLFLFTDVNLPVVGCHRLVAYKIYTAHVQDRREKKPPSTTIHTIHLLTFFLKNLTLQTSHALSIKIHHPPP